MEEIQYITVISPLQPSKEESLSQGPRHIGETLVTPCLKPNSDRVEATREKNTRTCENLRWSDAVFSKTLSGYP